MRFSLVEWVLLAILLVVPVAFWWHFASPSYFHSDDIAHFYSARNSSAGWSYAFASSIGGHMVPAYRLAYLTLDRVAPMNFEVALAFLVACQTVSAVLLQRILTLVFGRAWWTYALALAWSISVAYLAAFEWFAGGLLSVPAITATLASIHGYLCWRAGGRPAWVAWSLVAMMIGLGFYVKALLIPLYLVLMRVLLLEPERGLRDSLRSLRGEWRVWLAYVGICAVYLLVYLLGDYQPPEGRPTLGDFATYLRIFWFEGFWPMVFGFRVSVPGPGEWDQVVIVAAQVAVFGLVAWSVARCRSAWRAWAFLLVTVVANALIVGGRITQWGPELAASIFRYYTEPAFLVPLVVAFAFASPRFSRRVGETGPAAPAAGPASRSRRRLPVTEATRFRLPTARVGIAALVALASYVGVTWVTVGTYANRAVAGADQPELSGSQSGRFARAYFDNLRADLAATRRSGVQPTLLDADVPEAVVPQFVNLALELEQRRVRFSLLSTVVPLFDDQVTFNRSGSLYIVRRDGHLQPTRFVPAATWSHAGLRGARPLQVNGARMEHRRRFECVVADGPGADDGLSRVEWRPRPHLRGRDWWLRARYRTDPVQPFAVQTNSGVGWVDEGPKLPPRGSLGVAFVPLSELPTGVPTNAGVRLLVPPFGRLCLRSLEIGYFDPPTPSP